MKICPYCESELSDTARKCKFCGEWVISKDSHKESPIKVFFFDTETTGKDPNVEQIIQFGGIYGIYDKNTGKFEEKERINQLVKPSKKIPEEASKVHGLYNKDLEGYGLIDEYIYEFLAFIKKADFVVGHNVEYDKTILIAETKGLNIPFDFSKVKCVDTMKPCTSLVQIPAPERSSDKYKWPKLIELHKFLFGKGFEDAHDAMADITATKDCFVELCNKYNFYENGRFKEKISKNDKVKNLDGCIIAYPDSEYGLSGNDFPDDEEWFFDEVNIEDEELKEDFMENWKDFIEKWENERRTRYKNRIAKIGNKLFKEHEIIKVDGEWYYKGSKNFTGKLLEFYPVLYPINQVIISVEECELYNKHHLDIFYTPYGRYKIIIDGKIYDPEEVVFFCNYTTNPRNPHYSGEIRGDKNSPYFLLSEIKRINGIPYVKYYLEEIDNEYYYISYDTNYGYDCFYALKDIEVKDYIDDDSLLHIEVTKKKPSKVLYKGEIHDISELVEAKTMGFGKDKYTYRTIFILKEDIALEKDGVIYDEYGAFQKEREESENKENNIGTIIAIIWVIIIIILGFKTFGG